MRFAKGCFLVVFGLVICLIGLTIVGAMSTSDHQRDRRQQARMDSEPEAIYMLSVCFEGGHSQAEIKALMDTVMSQCGMELTQDNYKRAGSVLVRFRKDHGIPEMELLRYMKRSHVPSVNMSFPDMAAICVAFMVNGDR